VVVLGVVGRGVVVLGVVGRGVVVLGVVGRGVVVLGVVGRGVVGLVVDGADGTAMPWGFGAAAARPLSRLPEPAAAGSWFVREPCIATAPAEVETTRPPSAAVAMIVRMVRRRRSLGVRCEVGREDG